MPTVVVSGYYGCGNVGDEAILGGLAEGFQRLAPSARLTVLSGDPARTEAEHGLSAAPRGLLGAMRRVRGCDLFVSGGGGLLQDATSWRSPLYYLALIQSALSAGTPVACVGQGVGPLEGKLVRMLTRRVLSRVSTLALRGQLSRDLLAEIGVAREMAVTADLAFLLPSPTEDESAAAWREAGLDEHLRGGVAVALRSPAGEAPEDLPRRLGSAISAACDRIGVPIVLVPMHPPADVSFAERTADEMARRPAIARASLSARQTLALISASRLVVAMRLHALIFAALGGVPPVAISYHPKIDELMEELGLPVATSSGAFDEEALTQAICDVWRRREEIAGGLRTRLPQLREAAARNLELVGPLLAGRA